MKAALGPATVRCGWARETKGWRATTASGLPCSRQRTVYGDAHLQNNAALFWTSLEVLLGYVMLGGLISIFANKLAQRA